MATLQAQKPQRASSEKATAGRLFVLDLSEGRIFTANPDGSDKTVIVSGCRLPDGVVVDAEAGHIYWTNMGDPPVNNGCIERADLDGRSREIIVPEGGTFTPKQLHLEKASGKLYWSDREGMRVMRCSLDGSEIETLVDTSQGDSPPAETKENGVSGSPSTPLVVKSTGRKKGPTRPARAASSARASTFPKGRAPPTAPTLSCSSTTFPSRSTWNSISRNALCTGPTAAIHRAATP